MIEAMPTETRVRSALAIAGASGWSRPQRLPRACCSRECLFHSEVHHDASVWVRIVPKQRAQADSWILVAFTGRLVRVDSGPQTRAPCEQSTHTAFASRFCLCRDGSPAAPSEIRHVGHAGCGGSTFRTRCNNYVSCALC